MPQIACTECTWRGDFSEAEQTDEVWTACPQCHAATVDEHGFEDAYNDCDDNYGDGEPDE